MTLKKNHMEKKQRFVNNKKTPNKSGACQKTNQPTQTIWSLIKKQIEPTKHIWSLSKKQIEPTKKYIAIIKLSVIIYIMHTFIRSSFGRQAYIVCKRTRANL